MSSLVVGRWCKEGQEEGPLASTEISSSSEYELEGKTSIGSALPFNTTPLSLSFNMSQHDLQTIILQ